MKKSVNQLTAEIEVEFFLPSVRCRVSTLKQFYTSSSIALTGGTGITLYLEVKIRCGSLDEQALLAAPTYLTADFQSLIERHPVPPCPVHPAENRPLQLVPDHEKETPKSQNQREITCWHFELTSRPF